MDTLHQIKIIILKVWKIPQSVSAVDLHLKEKGHSLALEDNNIHILV